MGGALRWISNRWGGGSGFNARVGTTVVGTRGTEFVVGYEPATAIATVLVNGGSVEMVSFGGHLVVDAGMGASSRDGVGIISGPVGLESGVFDEVLMSDDPLAVLIDTTDIDDFVSPIAVGAIVASLVRRASRTPERLASSIGRRISRPRGHRVAAAF